jgi:hypothetical protein
MSIVSTIEHSTQRKYTLLHGQCKDHAGDVKVDPIKDFDLNATIFKTLNGKLPRLFMKAKIAKKSMWVPDIEGRIKQEFIKLRQQNEISPIDPVLVKFMDEECDFNAEHADGSFMEHLVYGYEYALRFYPQHSANVMLLHSILGTATNTFAMEATKIPALQSLLTEFEFRHIGAFPSFLRLMYEPKFFSILLENKSNITNLQGIRFHRVIDNEVIMMSSEDLWIQLNYHLMHLVDFLPVANWQTHSSDPLLQIFIQLSDFLDVMGERQAQVILPIPPAHFAKPLQETLSWGSRLSNWIPTSLKMKLATKSIRTFSKNIGHSLDFELIW